MQPRTRGRRDRRRAGGSTCARTGCRSHRDWPRARGCPPPRLRGQRRGAAWGTGAVCARVWRRCAGALAAVRARAVRALLRHYAGLQTRDVDGQRAPGAPASTTPLPAPPAQHSAEHEASSMPCPSASSATHTPRHRYATAPSPRVTAPLERMSPGRDSTGSTRRTRPGRSPGSTRPAHHGRADRRSTGTRLRHRRRTGRGTGAHHRHCRHPQHTPRGQPPPARLTAHRQCPQHRHPRGGRGLMRWHGGQGGVRLMQRWVPEAGERRVSADTARVTRARGRLSTGPAHVAGRTARA